MAPATARKRRRGRRRGRREGRRAAPTSSPGQTGIWGGEAGDRVARIPAAVPARCRRRRRLPRGAAGEGLGASATLVADPPDRCGRIDDVTDAGDSPPTKERIEYRLPPLEPARGRRHPDRARRQRRAVHARNEEIIVRKLASFGITGQIVGRNAGPVVTQYEVQPAVDVRVSRIEALADDLAMALAARSLRIEAPIPGKSAVGIEIPNQDFNVVAPAADPRGGRLRRDRVEADVRPRARRRGQAQAVDLAKMPHLLIAGATGSGKSVMVNALHHEPAAATRRRTTSG